MADNGIGDYFISDIDDELVEEEDEFISVPVVVPAVTQSQPAVQPAVQPAAQPVSAPQPAPVAPQPVPATPQPVAAPVQPVAVQAPAPVRPQVSVRQATREERLAAALDALMEESPDIQAAALVSMDGFTMASALPTGMQEDRVGAMSAAILGLGERAAAELGRGQLTQVFIEGDDGYVVLIAAGDRAVLTALAQPDAKLGLVLYDMKAAADVISEVLG